MKPTARQKTSKPVAGATETIAASVPSALVREVRQHVGKGEFSRFVASALRRELVRLNRARFISDFESEFGPLDKKAVERARRAIRS